MQNPKAAETVIEKREITLEKGEKLVFSKDTIAVFDKEKRVDNQFIAQAKTTLCEYYMSKRDDRHPNRVDSTNKDVIDTFINNTYEKYKSGLGDAFGMAPAIFTDEPSVITALLPENAFEVFLEEYGYDVRDYIYCIYDPSMAKSRRECQARIDYGRLLGKLFYENYCKNLQNWCAKNSKLFAGHLDLDHLPDGAAHQCYFSHLHALSCFDIPGVDVIWHQISMPKEGNLPVSEGAPFFPRLASSAAHISGKNLALTESFAVYGEGVTPDEFRYVLNYQAMRGINVFNIMLSATGLTQMLSLIERPVFSPKKPGFYDLKHINTYFARLSYLLRLGEAQIDTALYIPCADFWANEKISQKASESYISSGNMLENNNIEFDIIDDYAVLEASATHEGLKIGNMCYRRVVVPDCEFMPKDVKQKLAPYIISLDDVQAAKKSHLRIMKRVLPSSKLYFIFNEGEELAEEILDIKADNLYRLNLLSGEITKAQNASVSLSSGDMAVFYETSEKLETVSEKIVDCTAVEGFKAVCSKQFVITEDGISMEEIPTKDAVDKDFSGEITYTASYELPNSPNPSDRYKIVLTDTSLSARICIDSKCVATLGMTPMEAIIYGADLKKQGVIEVTVANTAANEIIRKNDMIMSLPPEVRGPYHAKSIEWEKDAPCLKFGSLKILKLAQ